MRILLFVVVHSTGVATSQLAGATRVGRPRSTLAEPSHLVESASGSSGYVQVLEVNLRKVVINPST